MGSVILKHKSGAGFTLIELIIVMAIIFVIAGAVAPIYGNLQSTTQLNETTSQAVQALRMARERSVSRYNNARHGVKFDLVSSPNKFILYQGTSYASRDAEYDRETTLSQSMSIVTTGLSPVGDDINFSMGLGIPDKTGSVNINHSVEGFKVININDYGAVTEN
jgi:prepilin-type N-terminal cleavage/methylation domain-containing protein